MKSLRKLLPGILFLFALATAQAQTAPATTVKYLGTRDDMILFNVSCPNPEGMKFSVTVKDQDGVQLFQGFFSDKSFYKQFRLPKTDKNKISFIVHNGKDADVVKTFEINVNSRFVEDIAVKKID